MTFLIVECETRYREVYRMTQEQFDELAFDEAHLIIAEAYDEPQVRNVGHESE